ncbi:MULTISPECIES: DUF6338 family protein [unclassified Pseudovibrio]|uniref:DUF6338 family protein n=1 Tax=unclassified Pseudovibrio TaxID=2627060 RepID=UPI0007AE8815|nr:MULTISPECIES: DUF6338 family protein [unclassified Pseudovibrio]KZL01094.1 hypothetical protein PsW74_01887 [Pseudovibrio sp. W74]KZL11159.1 hypothetical protein PsAD14_00908 [Pseudovibrio sp. Ad14]
MNLPDILKELNLASALLGIAVLSPGFIIVFCRSRYVTGRVSNLSTFAMEFVVTSSVYYSFSGPIFIIVDAYNWFSLSILVFWGPIIVGVTLGGLTQWKWAKQCRNFLGLNPVTPHPTGWDTAFGTLTGDVWLTVHTVDLGVLHGRFGYRSNASNDLSRRDIFIEELRGNDFAKLGEADEIRGVWIKEDQIIAVEIAQDRDLENDQQ